MFMANQNNPDQLFVSHAINGLPVDSYFDVGPGSFFVE
jgi:hypothetical protein